MARKRFFGRIVDVVKRAFSPPTPEPTPTPRPPSRPPTYRPPPAVDDRTLRQRVIDHIVATVPMAHAGRVARNVGEMDEEERRWTVNATADQLRQRARMDADRMLRLPDGSYIPLNPWWYK